MYFLMPHTKPGTINLSFDFHKTDNFGCSTRVVCQPKFNIPYSLFESYTSAILRLITDKDAGTARQQKY